MAPRSSGFSGANGFADPSSAREALATAIDLRNRDPLAPTLARRGLGPYRGYGEVLSALSALADRGAELRVIGRSVKREPLFAVHLGAHETPRARTSVILAGVHPTEWIGVETCLRLLERLASSDLGNRSIIAVPVVNPDGYLLVEENLRRGRRRFERHNAHGVDLNRNFDARWGKRGLLQRFMPWMFAPGDGPASEPEVSAIAYALANRRIDRAVSLHSFGGVVLYPSASSIWPVADAAEHRAWATRVGKAADRRAYRAFPGSWWACGVAQGGLELDWFHERHGAVSLLVECSRGGVGLRPALGRPPLGVGGIGRFFEPFAWFNPPGVDLVTLPLSEALEPFVKGDRL